jgi:hypothetical protein
VGHTSVAETIKKEMDDVRLDDDVSAAVREWLSADREFNVWFLETTKGKMDDDALMSLLSGYSEDQDAVTDGWKTYREDQNGPRLIAVLARSRATMDRLQGK